MANKVGKPTVMTESTLQILEDAFICDASDEQACFLANISPATLYNYQVAHPEYIERKKQLKEMVKFRAKKTVAENIKDVETAKWYLERKAKSEGFSQRTEVTDGEGKPVPLLANIYVRTNNSTNQTIEPKEEN